MILSTAQLRWGRVVLIIFGAATISYTFWPIQHEHYFWTHSQQVWDDLEAIENRTLGFGKILAINIPSRADKSDNIALGSSVCNFHVDLIDGVLQEDINSKSYPYNWNYDHQPSEYAARRAHVNGMKRIIRDRIGSAIIMEDDADWDVNIKTQLKSFALGVRALQGTTDTPCSSPYGDDWDILWIGHCGIECKEDLPFYRTPNDPTVPEPRHFLPYFRDPPPFERSDQARLTCTANDGVCSSMYAVSYHGAQRILAALSVNPSGLAEEINIGAQFDVSLGRMCGKGYLRCFAPYPALTGAFRSAGGAGKASDIHDEEGEPVGFASWGVLYSTMLNVNRILNGDPVYATWEANERESLIPSTIDIEDGSIYLKVDDGEREIPSVAIDEQQRKHRVTHISME
ncbi:uncharacterized protein N7483_000881 [Penicillium malachiteum]|uniref:uncharacterized protein n=1 Tax=Penicillium malachiteum TaxID=1324776 RepID=UPI002547C0FE|nr:uncharacterized protein N7483_000881 [Penicillium malachiteum]KAJ5735756.1 hypothetical protein N7483_000881 [Penicillium malachiteum]